MNRAARIKHDDRVNRGIPDRTVERPTRQKALAHALQIAGDPAHPGHDDEHQTPLQGIGTAIETRAFDLRSGIQRKRMAHQHKRRQHDECTARKAQRREHQRRKIQERQRRARGARIGHHITGDHDGAHGLRQKQTRVLETQIDAGIKQRDEQRHQDQAGDGGVEKNPPLVKPGEVTKKKHHQSHQRGGRSYRGALHAPRTRHLEQTGRALRHSNCPRICLTGAKLWRCAGQAPCSLMRARCNCVA